MKYLLLLSGLLLSPFLRSPLFADKPNVIVIMADDMGWECVSAYRDLITKYNYPKVNSGEKDHYSTPHIDKLATNGMRFDHGYSQPICTPSRVQIMTGIYNQRNYVKFGLLDSKARTFGNVMKDAGYRTCIVGKWQLEGGFDGPKKFGFDEYCLWQLTRRPARYPNPGMEVNGKEIDYPGKYGPDIASDYLCDFIERNKDRPFFGYYPMILPHWPFEPTPDSEDWDPKSEGAETGNLTQKKPKYFREMVSYVDKIIGKIVAKLDEQKLTEETLIIFTGDNGTAVSVTGVMNGREIKGGKGSTPDAGNHVPFIVSWPGTIEAGTTTKAIVNFSDILPTVAQVAGAEIKHKIDGISFLGHLKGGKAARQVSYSWYARNGGPTGKEFARNADWKLYSDGKFYNVYQDVMEKNPLSPGELSDKARMIRTQLQKELKRMEGTRTIFDLSKYQKPGANQTKAPKSPDSVLCAGKYAGHLQGICRGSGGNFFWSFTQALVKTNIQGKVMKKVKVADHHGDVCFANGKIYCAVNFGAFNDPKGNADNWVYVYDSKNLEFLAKHPVPEVKHGAGGIAVKSGRFIVVGGLPEGIQENYVYEYDKAFHFKKRHIVKSGWTKLGIQAAAFAQGHWWFGCYGNVLLKTTPDFKVVGKYNFNCGYGVLRGPNNKSLYCADGTTDKGSSDGNIKAVKVAKFEKLKILNAANPKAVSEPNDKK
ncbi:MAG: sulfatase-like hydrolase/transferase [Verrucomicrobiota bacterium]|nr:sulfatase-like hydrolase/transferase [Verrucomicrobiota bacterium]